MARKDSFGKEASAKDAFDPGEKTELLRALSFQVHRKRVADEVLAEHMEQQFRNGRHKEFRAANDILMADGFVPALLALGIVGAEAAVVLEVVAAAKDHRLLSDALGRLADYLEGPS